MSTVNEPAQHQFLTRVSEIPLVKAFIHTVAATYETTKNASPLIGSTLDKVEGVAKYANDQAEPLKKLFDRPLSTVSAIADRQLEELQHRFPVINTTPNEVLEFGHNLYERTGIKHRVEDIVAAKNHSVDKITSTTIYYRNRVVGTANRYVSGALDYSENVIDKFIASPDGKKRSCTPPDGSYVTRVRCLSGKVVGGVSYKTASSYNTLKQYTVQTYELADNAIKNTTAAVAASIQKAISDVGRIREAILRDISKRSHELTAASDSAAVFLTKTLSNGVADFSDRAISFAAPIIPEGLEKPAASLVSYTHHWQERVRRASTTGDIWKVATDETKKNLRVATEALRSILNNSDAQAAEDKKRW